MISSPKRKVSPNPIARARTDSPTPQEYKMAGKEAEKRMKGD